MARAADQVRAQGMSLRTAGPSEHFLPLATIRTRTGPTPDPCARSAMRSEIDRRRIQERLASRSNGGSGRSEPATRLLKQRSSLRAPSRSLRIATTRLIRLIWSTWRFGLVESNAVPDSDVLYQADAGGDGVADRAPLWES